MSIESFARKMRSSEEEKHRQSFSSMAFLTRELLLPPMIEARIARSEAFQNLETRRGGATIPSLPANLDFGEYTLDSNPLTASDAGSWANIVVNSFRVFWPDKPNGVSYRGVFTLTRLLYSTEYSVYVDDLRRSGGGLTNENVSVTTVPVDVARFRNLGRIYIGKVTTPVAGGGGTSGSQGGGSYGGGDPPSGPDQPPRFPI